MHRDPDHLRASCVDVLGQVLDRVNRLGCLCLHLMRESSQLGLPVSLLHAAHDLVCRLLEGTGHGAGHAPEAAQAQPRQRIPEPAAQPVSRWAD